MLESVKRNLGFVHCYPSSVDRIHSLVPRAAATSIAMLLSIAKARGVKIGISTTIDPMVVYEASVAQLTIYVQMLLIAFGCCNIAWSIAEVSGSAAKAITTAPKGVWMTRIC